MRVVFRSGNQGTIIVSTNGMLICILPPPICSLFSQICSSTWILAFFCPHMECCISYFVGFRNMCTVQVILFLHAQSWYSDRFFCPVAAISHACWYEIKNGWIRKLPTNLDWYEWIAASVDQSWSIWMNSYFNFSKELLRVRWNEYI